MTAATRARASAPAVAALVHGLGEGEPPATALVGGKAASVDRLARLGFVTPPGAQIGPDGDTRNVWAIK